MELYTKVPELATIRQTAAFGILSERQLRIRVKEGRCPGFYVGNRFMVNIKLLCEQVNKESMENVKYATP